ncbi:MAG: hypothetical protein M3203_03915 [Actinomycetota bacterium]|nr:hypothetical protein [Actinomycetota bacterium]
MKQLFAVVGALALAVAGCGGDGKGDTGLGGLIRSVRVVTEAGDFEGAVDATLSPAGDEVFFTARSSGGPGVFRVPASGGPATAVATGAPFRSPVGIAMASDGQRVYVADTEADVILSAAVAGGPPAPVPGTEGTRPRGLEVVDEGGADVVYFTGRDRADGAPGVFSMAATGGPAPRVLARGAPLTSTDAVTVTRTGEAYVTDRGGAHDGRTGAVYRISGGSTEKIADLRAPVLAGVALTLDESVLLVSALSGRGTDQVLVVDLASRRTGTFSRTIGENRAGAGLHRARNVDVFAWADFMAGADRRSRVYVLEP